MEKVSFKYLLTEELTLKDKKIRIRCIRIPMIQRDYAQGRKGEEIVRDHFLESIFNALVNSDDILKLDFVYGSVEQNEKDFHFIPLDGQQRLTTLFLLYWYIGTRELQNDAEGLHRLTSLLTRFTYETRNTSSKFCEKLASCKVSFEKSPSEEIMDHDWFHLIFKKDPTIKAMLNMLDAIHEKYNELSPQSFFDKLELLQFYILPLSDYNLSDELYIKMNARGKQLSEYENFKADLIKWMKNGHKEEQFQKSVKYKGKEMPYYLEIATKLDNTWTDLFWAYSNKKAIDPMMMRFVHRFLVNQHIINTGISNKELHQDRLFKAFYGDSGDDNVIIYQDIKNYKELLEIEENFSTLVLVLDALSLHYKVIRKVVKPIWGIEWDFFADSINQRQRIVFLALTLYLVKNPEFNETLFSHWVRVVWNITENTNIDSVRTMAGLMGLISELSEYSNEIYRFLGDFSNEIKSDSSAVAVNEERLKASFILKDPLWEGVFMVAEAHSLFRGSIDFIMTEDMTMDLFKRRTTMANQVFDENGVRKHFQGNGHIFLRALISRINEDLIGLTFTDTIDKDNHLRSMLASNQIIKNTTRLLFSLDSVEDMEIKLNEFVKEDSQMKGWGPDSENFQKRLRRSHEALYKKQYLQKWMQANKATRFGWNEDHLYISEPKSWYNWVMVDTCRNQVINKLITEFGFHTGNICSIDNDILIPYYWGKHDIEVIGKIYDFECNLIFDNQSNLSIWIHDDKTGTLNETLGSIEKNQFWICIKRYDYCDENVYDELVRDIFDENNSQSIVSTIKPFGN